jgi:predicted dehydrogenase
MKTINFGIIGLGMMGVEFASAAMRWSHLPEMDVRPKVVSICSRTLKPEVEKWYREGLGTVTQATKDYRELLANPEVAAVYCAVPHHLHEQMYIDIIKSGKHLFGEKPFGIDKQANAAILEAAAAQPEVFVRCVSQYYFVPGAQRIGRLLEKGFFGRLIEAEVEFLHSSDLNLNKPINWKRTIEFNGEYGCMGDLGMHILAVPFRAGWVPKNVRAVLSNLVPERPDGKGGTSVCETWDNATLFCETEDTGGECFPMTVKAHRISPGEKNTWSIRIKGMKGSARFSTKNINSIEILEYTGGEQIWQHIDLGHETAFKSITGPIFEFGFSDAMLQMMAGFLYELQHNRPLSTFAGCVTPEETRLSHRLFTAALESERTGSTAEV